MAAGRVTTGFSKPYVAKYTVSSGSPTYSSGQLLARGVSMQITPETADGNDFYADNLVAETEGGVFTSGELSLTVDGLHMAAEKMIMGLPTANTSGLTAYGDEQSIPYVGFGAIQRTQSEGVVGYRAVILPKVKYQLVNIDAATQEESIDWQTQELTATIFRADDAKRNWKYVGTVASTEALAEATIKTFFGIS